MEPRRALLSDKESVSYLHERGIKTTTATMKNQRSYGKWNLKFHRLAGRIYYDPDDLDQWIDQNRFAEGGRRCPRPTTPPAPAEAAAAHQQVHGGRLKVPEGGARGVPAEAAVTQEGGSA